MVKLFKVHQKNPTIAPTSQNPWKIQTALAMQTVTGSCTEKSSSWLSKPQADVFVFESL